MQESIWNAGVSMPRFPKLKGDLNTQVLIVGGGLAGLLCAYFLKLDGVDYALIESDRICQGTTARTTGKITSQHDLVYHKLLSAYGPDRARGYWQLQREALEMYRQLGTEISCDLIREDNVISSMEGKDLDAELQALKVLQIPAEFVEAGQIPIPSAGGVCFRDQLQFHPLKFAAGIAEGLNIYEQTPAREFGPGWVKTDQGTIWAKKIILATHYPILNKHGAYFLKLYQDRSYMLALEGGEEIAGMYLGEGKNGISLRRQGNQLILGGSSHRTGKPSPGWKPLEEYAARLAPNAKVQYRWAAQDCMSLDHLPYIGQYSPRIPNIYVATGFGKWGMSNSMAAGLILSRAVQGKSHPLGWVVEPNRSMLHPQLAANALESAVNLLRPAVPRCPHLGCALRWNPRERSWDCPCHGSRFTREGKLVENPATGDLKRKGSKS